MTDSAFIDFIRATRRLDNNLVRLQMISGEPGGYSALALRYQDLQRIGQYGETAYWLGIVLRKGK